MDGEHKRILRKNRLVLARSLDLSELLQYLVQENVLSDTMVERIESKSTTFGKNVSFLNALPTRGPNAFKKFIEGLRETNQDHLISNLTAANRENAENRPPQHHALNADSAESTLRSSLPFINHQSPHPCTVSTDLHDGSRKLTVEKSTLDFYKNNFHRGYKMTSRPRGYALLVNVTEFDPGVDLPQRQGGNLDKANLEQVLRYLGFETLLVENAPASVIKTRLKSFSQKEEHKSRDSCIVALLTHGRDGAIYGRDGKLVGIEEIFSYFDNANCPNLRNKPKIFFVQACRGELYDQGVDETDGKTKNHLTSCASTAIDIEYDEPRLPTRSDMIFGYATQRGQAAMRNTHHGSWYIEALVKVLAKNAKNRDLAEMLTTVNSVIKGMQCYSPETDLHACKEMPIFHSTLCKKLYLFPGIYQTNP